MPPILQPSFARGELAPELTGRSDTAVYALGLKTARNAVVHPYGAISSRGGLKFVAPVKDHSSTQRLIKFQFKSTDTYLLEFGNLYMRVFRNSVPVTETTNSISGATQANPVVVTSTAHGYSNGDEVYIDNVVGMVELNARHYKVANVTANTFELTEQVDGTNVDGTSYTAYSSAGDVGKIFEITTPYVTADLFQLDFVQSADTMTIVHNNYAIRDLTRTDHNAWTLSEVTFGPIQGFPTAQTVTVDSGSGTATRYRVTAIARSDQEESLPATNNTTQAITGATQADPVVITATSHGYANGDEVEINSVVGMTELNGNRYVVANQTTNTFELTDVDGNNIDGTGFTAYTSGGTAASTFVEVSGASSPDNTISWTAVTGAERYAVYRRKNGIYGLIGETELTTFKDDNINPDTTETPSQARNPFNGPNNWPGAVGFYEQRKVFGGTLNKPDTISFSQIGRFNNFDKSTPIQDDNAFDFTLASEEVNTIRNFVSGTNLSVLTEGAQWVVNSGPESAFTPSTVKSGSKSADGANFLQPIRIGDSILFVEDNNGKVRTVGTSFPIEGESVEKGEDIGLTSRHLLDGKEIIDWVYSKTPDSRIHIVLNDGTALTLTFEQSQQVIAWTRWDTSGNFKAVSNLPNVGTFNEDSVYFVVERVVNGNTVKYIEVNRQTFFNDVRDCFFVDSGLTLDAPVTISGATAANPVVITATAHGFSDGDEVDIFDIIWTPTVDEFNNETQPAQLNTSRYTVANSTANTFELNDSSGSNIDGSAFTAYVSGGTVRKAVNTVTGLFHLEGRSLSVLGDGNVITNQTVSGGKLTFTRKFSRIHAGIPFVVDIETLPPEDPNGSIRGDKKTVPEVIVRMNKSRGLFAGVTSSKMVEAAQREFEKLGDPTALKNGDVALTIPGDWNEDGSVFLRQKDPLPMTILSITKELEIGAD